MPDMSVLASVFSLIAAAPANPDRVLAGDEVPADLPEACQDHLIELAIDESALTRRSVAIGSEAWTNG